MTTAAAALSMEDAMTWPPHWAKPGRQDGRNLTKNNTYILGAVLRQECRLRRIFLLFLLSFACGWEENSIRAPRPFHLADGSWQAMTF